MEKTANPKQKYLQPGQNVLEWLLKEHTQDGVQRVREVFLNLMKKHEINVHCKPNKKNKNSNKSCYFLKKKDQDILFEKFALQLPILIYIENCVQDIMTSKKMMKEGDQCNQVDSYQIDFMETMLMDPKQSFTRVSKIIGEKYPKLEEQIKDQIYHEAFLFIGKLKISTKEIIEYFNILP